MWLVILAALLPVVLLFGYIWYQDIKQPEPLKWLLKGLLYGALSVPIVLMVVSPLGGLEVVDERVCDGSYAGRRSQTADAVVTAAQEPLF